MYAPMIRSFVYRAFASCIVRFSYRSCEAFVRSSFISFAFSVRLRFVRNVNLYEPGSVYTRFQWGSCDSIFILLSNVLQIVASPFCPSDLRSLVTLLITFLAPIYPPATNILVVWRTIMIYINVHIVLCQEYSPDIKHSNCKIKMTLINRAQISNVVRMTRFWNNLHQVHSESKAKQFKVLEAIKPKGLNMNHIMSLYLMLYQQ